MGQRSGGSVLYDVVRLDIFDFDDFPGPGIILQIIT
jgi:hypothetical protein